VAMPAPRAVATPWYLLPVKYLYLGVREFLREGGLSRSSSLAYASLLSLIPLAAVVLSFVGSFQDASGTQERIIAFLESRLLWEDLPTWEVLAVSPPAGNPSTGGEPPAVGDILDTSALERWRERLGEDGLEVKQLPSPRQQVTRKLTEFVDNIRSSLATIGVIGALALVVASIGLLNAIETTLNRLWHVRVARNPLRKFLLFWALLTLGPLLLLGSFVFGAKLDFINRGFENWLPYLFTWGAFFLLYFLVPYTRVSFPGAVVAATVAGLLWEGEKHLFSRYVAAIYTGSTSYIRITYGSVALIPIFLVWLYLSWLVVLLGVKLCYVWQHLAGYAGPGWSPTEPTFQTQELLAARVVATIAGDRYQGGDGLTLDGLAGRLGEPQRLVEPIVTRLREAGLVAESAENRTLLLTRPPDALTVDDVTRAVRGDGPPGEIVPPDETPASRRLAILLGEIDQTRAEVLGSTTFRDLHESSDG
jgi:membrane protein